MYGELDSNGLTRSSPAPVSARASFRSAVGARAFRACPRGVSGGGSRGAPRNRRSRAAPEHTSAAGGISYRRWLGPQVGPGVRSSPSESAPPVRSAAGAWWLRSEGPQPAPPPRAPSGVWATPTLGRAHPSPSSDAAILVRLRRTLGHYLRRTLGHLRLRRPDSRIRARDSRRSIPLLVPSLALRPSVPFYLLLACRFSLHEVVCRGA